MKIQSIELFKVPPRWLFLKITTDTGLSGWGEPVIEGRADTVAAAVRELEEYLIGKEAGRIEDLWNVLYRAGFYRGGPVLMSAISGIEQALWDIKGKALGVPVYELLGGVCHDKMKVYCWIGGDQPDEVLQAAKEKYERGTMPDSKSTNERNSAKSGVHFCVRCLFIFVFLSNFYSWFVCFMLGLYP